MSLVNRYFREGFPPHRSIKDSKLNDPKVLENLIDFIKNEMGIPISRASYYYDVFKSKGEEAVLEDIADYVDGVLWYDIRHGITHKYVDYSPVLDKEKYIYNRLWHAEDIWNLNKEFNFGLGEPLPSFQYED